MKKIRSGKILKFTVEASDKENAEKIISNICQELRIFNPLVSNIVIESKNRLVFLYIFLLFYQLIIYL